MSDHTYLFEEATWDAEGIFTDADGNQLPIEGAASISHTPDTWVLSGKLLIQSEPPLELENHYAIAPFRGTRHETSWTSHNPELGRLQGRFVIVEDTLISTFTSPDGDLHGTEVLVQIDADSYENRGLLYQGDRLLSTWAISLSRSQAGILH